MHVISIDDPMDRALTFLMDEQMERGNFMSFRSSDKVSFDNQKSYATTFIPSLICSALAGIDLSKSVSIRRRVVEYLKTQENTDGSYNYWDKDSAEYTSASLPNDLDDTFCACIAIYSQDKDWFTGERLAKLAHMLIATESTPGGPYNTWLVPESTNGWKDIDPVVNANVATFMQLLKVNLPKVRDFVGGQTASHYYVDQLIVNYFVGRYLPSRHSYQFHQKQLTEIKDNPLLIALSITILSRQKAPTSTLMPFIMTLLDMQLPSGGWNACSLYLNSRRDGAEYAGSASLTTAYCIEALSVFNQSQTQYQASEVRDSETTYSLISDTIRSIPSVFLRNDLEAILLEMRSAETLRNVVGTPRMIGAAFGARVDAVKVSQFEQLSLWGWLAYTLYDNIMDSDASPRLLPAAIFCSRQLHQVSSDLFSHSARISLEVDQILQRIDEANAWEMKSCHVGDVIRIQDIPDYGDYWQLADRSLGHMISGLGMLYASKAKISAAHIRNYKLFFKHYLIARQLNDEVHDWDSDLKKGHINAVGAKLLKRYLCEGQAITPDQLSNTIERLRKLLWDSMIAEVHTDTLFHVNEAKKALKRAKAPALAKLLDPIMGAIHKTQRERTQLLDFIDAV